MMDQDAFSNHFHQYKPVDKLVYLVTQDLQFGSFLSHQIIHFGYFIQVVTDIHVLDNAIAEHASIAILVDVSSLQISSDEQIILEIRNTRQSSIPVMYISDHDDQSTRLNAIRAGATAFFEKPVDLINLVDKLDSIQITQVLERQRVLIMEDQQSIAYYYQIVLKQSGLEVEVVNDPNYFLQKVIDFHPDLILMDLYMPVVSGFELVKLIRQMDEFVSIPIMFLSTEDDFDRRMEAMNLGGDDFLIKPIKAPHLVELVKNRLERLRTLRSYMVRDSLTGLINHTTFRGMLGQEVNRCLRQKGKFSLAMIDLDHFKKVNDTFGHRMGDSVLKSLSRLLRQRLRKSDIIGRYGGEEFVVLMQNTDADQAFVIMDEIRNHFSEVEHHMAQKDIIFVTFSCGISSFPEFLTAKMLSDAADKAMYAAKDAGRNRIVIAKVST